MSFKFVKRAILEWKYYTNTPWSVNQVGKFWDTVKEYDDINSKIYPYRERFINSKILFKEINFRNFKPKKILDIQTRTGNGSIFWSRIIKSNFFYIADFSKNFLDIASKNLKNKKINFKSILIKKNKLPFKEKFFDFILCYETIEHIYNYNFFCSELSKITKTNGIVILTTPNISWELIHWITAIIGINHSEGPHRFISKKKLENCFKNNNFKILSYNTTIFLPFNNKISIKLDKLFMKFLPNSIKELICLRHSYILRKI